MTMIAISITIYAPNQISRLVKYLQNHEKLSLYTRGKAKHRPKSEYPTNQLCMSDIRKTKYRYGFTEICKNMYIDSNEFFQFGWWIGTVWSQYTQKPINTILFSFFHRDENEWNFFFQLNAEKRRSLSGYLLELWSDFDLFDHWKCSSIKNERLWVNLRLPLLPEICFTIF